MMRRLLVAILTLACVVSTGDARKQIPKAGEITDGVYSDANHGFSLTLPSGWEAKVKEAKSECRLELVQEKFELPADLEPYRDQLSAPAAEVWLVELPFNTAEYIDSLNSDSYNSDLKSKLLGDLREPDESMKFEGFATSDRRGFKAGSLNVAAWRGLVNYTVDMGTESGKISFCVGYFGVKKGDLALLVLVYGYDKATFKGTFDQLATMVESLDWK